MAIRGYGHAVVTLPSGGERTVNADALEESPSKRSPEFFDAAAVAEKRNEKLHRVQFFDGARALNGELKPITYRGAEARARSTFDAPRLTVEAIMKSDANPQGGWRVRLESKMPAADDRGPLALATTVKLGRTGIDHNKLPVQALKENGTAVEWFIPRDEDVGGVKAKTGQTLVVGARGLGWFAALELPKVGTKIDSAKKTSIWGFREDQYNRRLMTPQVVGRAVNQNPPAE